MKQTFLLLILLLLGWEASAQTVKGTVTTEDGGEPLIGVAIQLKGTDSGTYTSIKGDYQLTVPSMGALFFDSGPQPVLVFSYAGYETVEVPVDGRGEINVVLKPLATELDEVVVTGTAAGLSPKTLSYSVGRIREADLLTVPTPTLGIGLQGKVPGLLVNQVGGQPGQGAYFQVRSANALANGQQPLLIVDGIFLSGATLADINPEDIDRVEILKGSAGTSLYGSQAANGVIQIFTRRGKNLEVGETRVTYRGEAGLSEAPSRYDLNTFTNREILDPDPPQPILGNPTEDNIHNTVLPNLQDYQEDYLFDRGLYLSNYLAVEGKTQATNFLLSYQRLRDEGVFQASDGYTRNAFRLNLDHLISNKFGVKVSSAYSTSRQDLLAPVSSGPNSYLATMLFMTPMFDLEASNEEDGSSYDWDIDNTGFGITNPLYDRANSDQEVRRTRLLGNLEGNYYVNDWLTLGVSAALDRAANAFEHFLQKGYLSINVPGQFGPLVTAGVNNSNGGGIQRTNLVSSYFVTRANAVVQRRFGKLDMALRTSFLYEDLTHTFNSAIGEDMAVSDIRSLDNARRNIFISSRDEEIVGYSGFAVADLQYDEKLIFSGLFRREGSSLFGPENRWANYYRVSGAYRLTEDINVRWLDELKLRASMGTSGIRPAYDQRFESFRLENGTAVKGTLGNEFLRPAYSTEMEIGIDARLFKAFDLEFNYSQITTEDQILLTPLSGAAGFSGQWRNAGTLDATVYEAGLNIDFAQLFNAKRSGLHWNLMTTFSRVEQTISRLDVPAYTTGPGLEASSLFLIEEGRSFGTMVGEVFATSLDQLQGQEGIDPDAYAINSAGYVVAKEVLGTPQETPYKLVDANGNPLVQPIGDINPDFRMGFANTLAFKGLQLYTLFDWKKGGDIYNLTRQWLYRDQRHGDVSADPDVPASFYGSDGLYNVLVANNHFVEDGSFFMLREAALSYTFQQPGGLFRGMESIRLSLIGRNLFTLTDYSGFHPDVTTPPRDINTLSNRAPDARGSDRFTPNGDPNLFYVDAFNYPIRRTFTFSLQATF